MGPQPGPYWHVIRFLDHPLLPANTTHHVPKIIKHGISDDGPMHPKSPHASGPDGVATLLFKMGREDWLERFLDVKGTETFTLVVGHTGDVWQQPYVKRHGSNVELGFYSSDGSETPGPGVRYTINSSGEWQPISTSDLGSEWGGTYFWVRGQGEAFAKHIWYLKRWTNEVATIEWTGMTEDDKTEARAWSEERKKHAKAENDSNANDNNTNDDDTRRLKYERAAEKIRKECRGGCGAQNTEFRCSKCKGVYYCSSECQREDWKYHKSVCGKINETN